MRGDAAAALAEIDAQHTAGADPAIVLTDLADFCHYVTRLKLAPNAALQARRSRRRSGCAARLSPRRFRSASWRAPGRCS